ncbi:MAG: SctK family type III secretion system sorting platform protein [Puniceicoccales bacterium]|jgi:hypothetical protein|nr:SctK family type III secretion system sorting platform protein [Puniceicoccales bacterium]
MAAVELREALDQDPEGVIRMLRLIYEPVTFLHPSRLVEWFPEKTVLAVLVRTRQGWLAVNRLVRERLRLKLEYPKPITEARHGLFFESPALLRRLARYAGAAFLAAEIRRVVRQRELRELMSCLGSEIYQFVLRKAFFFRMQDLPIPTAGEKKSLVERVEATGRGCITACLFDLPQTLRERFPLKFAADEQWPFAKGVGRREAEGFWKFLARLRDYAASA